MPRLTFPPGGTILNAKYDGRKAVTSRPRPVSLTADIPPPRPGEGRKGWKMIEIRLIGPLHKDDINIPNQPFEVWGRMIPSLKDGKWEYRTERLPGSAEMCFPDYPYDPETYGGVFFGAYDGDRCIGLAALKRGMFRYLYLDDLKVDRAYRGQGIGGMLIEACMKEAEAQHLLGVYTVGQDNNLSACLFYLAHGFEIGGFNNRDYRGTVQEDKSDIYFYRDCSKKAGQAGGGTQ